MQLLDGIRRESLSGDAGNRIIATIGLENLIYICFGMPYMCRCLSGRAEHPEVQSLSFEEFLLRSPGEKPAIGSA
jgi:hypothetical protein